MCASAHCEAMTECPGKGSFTNLDAWYPDCLTCSNNEQRPSAKWFDVLLGLNFSLINRGQIKRKSLDDFSMKAPGAVSTRREEQKTCGSINKSRKHLGTFYWFSNRTRVVCVYKWNKWLYFSRVGIGRTASFSVSGFHYIHLIFCLDRGNSPQLSIDRGRAIANVDLLSKNAEFEGSWALSSTVLASRQI